MSKKVEGVDNDGMESAPLTIIENAAILPDADIETLVELQSELEHGFIHGQVFRTRTEAEVSVLNDLKFPTIDSKYWQSVREQQVHFSELVMLSYEYKKNLREIEILQAEVMELEEKCNNGVKKEYERIKLNAQIGIKEIGMAQKKFIASNQRRTAQGRIAEITNWHEIKDQLEPSLQFSKDDVNAHQLGSYLRRFINQYLTMKRQNFKNVSLPEVNNLTGQLITALKKAAENNMLDDVLSAYSPIEVRVLSSVSDTEKGVLTDE